MEKRNRERKGNNRIKIQKRNKRNGEQNKRTKRRKG